MVEVQDDVRKTLDVVSGKGYDDYSNIYFSSNENMNALFNNFDVKDKDVFCVLASSDQLFYSYLRGAKSVDTYDINKLTYYYYYLRKWVIEYFGDYYPIEKISNEYISNLLKKVKVKSYDEEIAYYYWSLFTNTICGYLTKKLFYRSSFIENNRIHDINKLKRLINEHEFNFINMDITDDNIVINKKYDVVITSNISEYFNDNILKINRYKRNISNLVKDDGVVVSSHIFRIYSGCLESKVFGKDYNIKEFPYCKDLLGDYAVGCSYKKKRLSTKNS